MTIAPALSSASTTPASAWTSRKLPSRSSEEVRADPQHVLEDERADEHAVGPGESRPPVSNVSSSQMIAMPQRSSRTVPSTVSVGESNCLSSGSTNSRKPVAVISRPLRLSGRRRHAIRPHATKAPPTRRKAMSGPSIGSSRNAVLTSTTANAATPAAHRAAQRTGLNRGAEKRRERGLALTVRGPCSDQARHDASVIRLPRAVNRTPGAGRGRPRNAGWLRREGVPETARLRRSCNHLARRVPR